MGCTLCPRACKVNRSEKSGYCSAGEDLLVGSVVIHRGEEPPLVQGAGSGAIFFSGCPLKCSYCQNMQISHHATGHTLSASELASYMKRLQDLGCSNINLVTPTHYTYEILDALDRAHDLGLSLPVIINSSGYEAVSTLELWKDHADIYLMDLKYGDNPTGSILSNVGDYWDVARQSIAYIFESAGVLRMDQEGRGVAGLVVRHLVLPGMLSNPFAVLDFLSDLSVEIPVSIMSQYNPDPYRGDINDMKRPLVKDEYETVLERALELGFSTIFKQDMDACRMYVPDFKATDPFGDEPNLL
ncbi:MAG TPA: radical SAM protein [Deltaproteobacteria bacterium]|nr:radical SAM protein [Deltaproteobacteria bacterium]